MLQKSGEKAHPVAYTHFHHCILITEREWRTSEPGVFRLPKIGKIRTRCRSPRYLRNAAFDFDEA